MRCQYRPVTVCRIAPKKQRKCVQVQQPIGAAFGVTVAGDVNDDMETRKRHGDPGPQPSFLALIAAAWRTKSPLHFFPSMCTRTTAVVRTSDIQRRSALVLLSYSLEVKSPGFRPFRATGEFLTSGPSAEASLIRITPALLFLVNSTARSSPPPSQARCQ